MQAKYHDTLWYPSKTIIPRKFRGELRDVKPTDMTTELMNIGEMNEEKGDHQTF
jgi:hypothetical protein